MPIQVRSSWGNCEARPIIGDSVAREKNVEPDRRASFENHLTQGHLSTIESHLTQDHLSKVAHWESSIESHPTQDHPSRVIYQSRVTLPRIIHQLTSFKNHHESHPTQDHPLQVIHQSRVTLTRIINRLTSFKNQQPRIIYQPSRVTKTRIINQQCHIRNHHESHQPRIINRKSSIKNHHRESPTQDHQSRVILTNVSQLPTLLRVALVRLLPMFLIGGLNALEARGMWRWKVRDGLRARSIVTSTQPELESWPWWCGKDSGSCKSLIDQFVPEQYTPAIALSTIVPAIRHSPTSFLIGDLEVLESAWSDKICGSRGMWRWVAPEL